MKIFNIFLKNLKKNPNKVFIKSNKISYTFKNVNDLINRFENCKIFGKYITIISENSINYFVLYLMSSKYNKTFVPLDHHLGVNSFYDKIKKFNFNNIFFF